MPSFLVRVLGLVLCLLPAARLAAQPVPLFLTTEDTRVRGIEFEFVSTQTFDPGLLQEQIVTDAPGFFDRVKKVLPFLSATYPPLDRVELQKDVVRLRRFYRQNGFLSPWVDYGESRLDTTSNRIKIVFEVEEGPPLIIQDVSFFAPDSSYATSLFDGEERERWIRFRDRTSFKTGDRYTDFDLARIQDQVLSWLKDRGYAFARFDDTEVDIDSTFNTADIRFYLRPGPRGYFDEVILATDDRVSRTVVLREMPFEPGDRFSYSELIEGQRELFSLNLFRLALADVPEDQPEDSSVVVRFRLRKAKLRYLSAQTGYTGEDGVTLEGRWTHRNFSGGARNLTVSALARTGILAQPSAVGDVPAFYRAAIALRQPYLFSNKVSGTVEPFVIAERNELLPESQERLGINRREFGVNTTVIYEALPFRPISLSYQVAQVLQPGGAAGAFQLERDAYSKSVLTLNGTLGRVNNYFNPRRGFLVRPFVEQAGSLGGVLRAGVTYTKAGAEVVGYLPLLRRVSLAARLAGGRLWPRGGSTNQFVPPFEDRFDPIRFYAGGPDDVRGWNQNLVGPKDNITSFVRNDSTGAIVIDPESGLPRTKNEQYNEVGGLAKLSGNVEVRLPFPGLGSKWRTAVFLDFGQVSAVQDPDQRCPPETQNPLPPGLGQASRQCGFRDDGRLAFGNFRFGTGAGLRYETPIGFIRVDIGFKINPDDLDQQKPRDAFLFEQGFLDEPKKSFLSRINLHVNIGQAF